MNCTIFKYEKNKETRADASNDVRVLVTANALTIVASDVAQPEAEAKVEEMRKRASRIDSLVSEFRKIEREERKRRNTDYKREMQWAADAVAEFPEFKYQSDNPWGMADDMKEAAEELRGEYIVVPVIKHVKI